MKSRRLQQPDSIPLGTVRAIARPAWWNATAVPLRLLFVFFMLAALPAAAQQPPLDDFDVVLEAVKKSFDARPGYAHGDLITRSQIADVLAEVAAAGVEIKGSARIVEKGLPDNAFLARELASPAGRRFMRKVARREGSYARLDRLSDTPRGKQLVSDLIRRPGGEKLIDYLGTTRGGRNMGAMLAARREGVDPNKPTGRIYTAHDLIAELERQYASGQIAVKND
jgi:hypothetical protein